MREAAVENYLVAAVLALGGICIKFRGSEAGWPDRLVVLPGGLVGFIELKRPGQTPRPLQLHRIKQLLARGVHATWADSFQAVDEFLKGLRGA